MQPTRSSTMWPLSSSRQRNTVGMILSRREDRYILPVREPSQENTSVGNIYPYQFNEAKRELEALGKSKKQVYDEEVQTVIDVGQEETDGDGFGR